jgi:hypothetical protein
MRHGISRGIAYGSGIILDGLFVITLLSIKFSEFFKIGDIAGKKKDKAAEQDQ